MFIVTSINICNKKIYLGAQCIIKDCVKTIFLDVYLTVTLGCHWTMEMEPWNIPFMFLT